MVQISPELALIMLKREASNQGPDGLPSKAVGPTSQPPDQEAATQLAQTVANRVLETLQAA